MSNYMKNTNPEFAHWVPAEPFNMPGDMNTPFCDLPYYKWLARHATGNLLNDHKGYLKSIGFIFGLDYLTQEKITILRHCNDQFYWAKYSKKQAV